MKAVIPSDVYDPKGNLIKIEFYDVKGTPVLDVLWTEGEEQTSKNRIEFREWAYKIIKQKGYVLYN
jgi:hypothetical protein